MKSVPTLIRLPIKLRRKIAADAKTMGVTMQSAMISGLAYYYEIPAELPVRGGQRKAKK